jgi:ribosomal protein S18 acetylase RimI-like enzyme
MNVVLRAATSADVDAIAHVWCEAWGDGHHGNVPAELHPYRTLAHFRARVPERIASTTVATLDARVVGFVTVHEDELEQIFVVEAARGGGAATQLVRHAEAVIGRGYETAWLAVVTGNDRALRFYEREGWYDTGPIQYTVEIEGGSMTIPTRRYEQRVV